MRRLVTALLLMLAVAARAEVTVRPHVYLVVIDGLGANQADPALMPRLADTAHGGIHGDARAAMPTRTNSSHMTLLTGVLPESHGITGNAYWDRRSGSPELLEAASLVEIPTLFTVVETTRPDLVTIAAFSKAKLGRLFAGVPGRQQAPDVLWTPEGEAASDAETMTAFLAAAADREPDLAAINLSEVDRTAHARGPDATEDARRHADAALGRLLDDLRTRGRWGRSLVIVTADHGFDDVTATVERPDPTIGLADRFDDDGVRGIRVVADGGTAHVYAQTIAADDATAGKARATLAWAAAVAWRTPGVADVLARLDVPGVPALMAVHPEWGLAHERAGDLLVIASPGFQFLDGRHPVAGAPRGNHGSPREMSVPLVILGGAVASAAPPSPPPSSADVGATIRRLLALAPPRRFDGRPVREGQPIVLPLR